MESPDDIRDWKARLRAALARDRAAFLWELVGLDRETLEAHVVERNLTAVGILADLTAGDELAAIAIEGAIGGGTKPLAPNTDAAVESRLQRFVDARAALLSALAVLEQADLCRHATRSETIAECVIACGTRDRSWSGRLRRSLADADIPDRPGPAAVLIAAVRAARKELLSAIGVLLPADRSGLAPQLAELQRRERSTLLHLQGGPPPEPEPYGGTPPNKDWSAVWHGLHQTHQELLRAIVRYQDDDLAAADGAAYRWISESLSRDRDLARHVRVALHLQDGYPTPPRASPDRTGGSTDGR